MSSAPLRSVYIEPDLHDEVESVLDDGESLSDFVESCVRKSVQWRRTQDAFLARAREAVDRGVRDGCGISPEQLLKLMDDRLDEARRRVSDRAPHLR